MKMIARETFEATTNHHGEFVAMSMATQVYVLVEAGDIVEVLPGGLFVNRGTDREIMLTNTPNNRYLIGEYCS